MPTLSLSFFRSVPQQDLIQSTEFSGVVPLSLGCVYKVQRTKDLESPSPCSDFYSNKHPLVTSISLSPDGEGSLLLFDRPRSFPSEARWGLSVSPSLAGVEGPLCVL